MLRSLQCGARWAGVASARGLSSAPKAKITAANVKVQVLPAVLPPALCMCFEYGGRTTSTQRWGQPLPSLPAIQAGGPPASES